MILTKRIYDAPGPHDGARFLVDRVWPRGVKKESVRLDGWIKDVAPSAALRKWFAHDPAKWSEFQRRYFHELDQNPAVRKLVLETARQSTVTLLFGARDTEHNNAVALKSYLENHRS